MTPDFDAVFSEARIINRVDRLTSEVSELRKEVKTLRAHNHLLTKSNLYLRGLLGSIEQTVELCDQRLNKIESEINSLCSSFKNLNLIDDA